MTSDQREVRPRWAHLAKPPVPDPTPRPVRDAWILVTSLLFAIVSIIGFITYFSGDDESPEGIDAEVGSTLGG